MNEESRPPPPPFKEKSTLTLRSPPLKSLGPREPSLYRSDRTRLQSKSDSSSDTEDIHKKTKHKLVDIPAFKPRKNTTKPNQQDSVQKLQLTENLNIKIDNQETKTNENIPKETQIQVKILENTNSNINIPVTPIEHCVETQPDAETTKAEQSLDQIRHPDKIVNIITNPILEVVETNTTRNMTNIKEIQQGLSFVPEFSGMDNVNRTNELTRFLGMADSIYNPLVNDEDKKIFSRLIQFKLTGDAYARIANRHIEDYETLRKILNNMYTRVFTLEELERKFTEIRQAYGESIRNFGYRVIEALENYKMGYKTKYEMAQIDKVYLQHLDNNAIQTFIRGLNNTILREKVATFKAKNVDELVNETEGMERMLEIANGANTTMSSQTYRNQNNSNQQNFTQVICNFCHKPNHTYDVCRLRQRNLQTERPYNGMLHNTTQARNMFTGERNSQPVGVIRNPHYQQGNFRQYERPAQQTNYTPYRIPTPRTNFPPKFCSHCKTTTGHTFDECRSKFYTNRNYNMNIHTTDKNLANNKELEERFNRMRISQIQSQQPNQQRVQPVPNIQGNASGSSQP